MNSNLTQALNQFFDYLGTIKDLNHEITFTIPDTADFFLEYQQTLNIRLHDCAPFGLTTKDILLQCLTEITEEKLGLDDYDEIDYMVHTTLEAANPETGKQELEITITYYTIR